MNDSSEVKLHFLDYWRVIKLRLGLILLTFFLVVVSTGVYVTFLPREYFSKVRIEIKPDNNRGLDPLSMGMAARSDPQFISTQFQVLRSTEILLPVIQRLDLRKKLSPPGNPMDEIYIARMLDRSMLVQEQRNTTLIDVGIFNTDRQLAADITNTIALVYSEKRVEYLRNMVDKTLREMRDELDNKRKEVTTLFQEAAKIRQNDGIVDPDTENSNALVSLKERPLIVNDQLRIEKRNRVNELKSQLETLESLKAEEMMEALRTLGIEDQTVSQNLPLLQAAMAEEAKVTSSGVGERHPRLLSLRAQKDTYRKILADQLESIKRAHRTRLKLEGENLATLEKDYEQLKKDQIFEKDRTNNYIEKKAAYLSAKALLLAIEQRYAAAKFDQVLSFEPVKIWEKAVPGFAPEKPKVPVYLTLGAVIGLIIGVALAFFIEYLDTSVKTLEDVERYLSLPVLAVVPTGVTVLARQKRETADSEVYRILKANIEFNQTNREANSYTLVSGGPGEGKSTTLNNLAYSYAKSGANVLVVDADLRRPSQHRIMDVENNVGLADYLQGKKELDEIVIRTKVDNLSFIPSGKLPQDDVGILNSTRMTDLMKKLKTQYDIVFFDSPPILGVSDASLLVSEVDNTIMVVQHRRFPRGMLLRVKQAVAHVGGHLIGVVLNNVDTKQDDSYSYYSSYNDYYTPRREKEAAKPVAVKKDDDGEY